MAENSDKFLKMPKFLALLVGLPALGYCIYCFRQGRVFIKGVVYTSDQAVNFSFSVALIASFAVMLLLLAFANEYMISPLNLGFIGFTDGLAMFMRVFVIFIILFMSVFLMNNSRL